MNKDKRVILDTNVLIRYLTEDDPDKADAVERLLNRAERREITIHLPSIVTAEMVWVLESYYGLARGKIFQLVEGILLTPGIEVTDRNLLINALNQYRKTSMDFIDAWTMAFAREEGIHTLYTFDKKHFSSIKGLSIQTP